MEYQASTEKLTATNKAAVTTNYLRRDFTCAFGASSMGVGMCSLGAESASSLKYWICLAQIAKIPALIEDSAPKEKALDSGTDLSADRGAASTNGIDHITE